jgi:hypothetical protein
VIRLAREDRNVQEPCSHQSDSRATRKTKKMHSLGVQFDGTEALDLRKLREKLKEPN